MKCVWFEEGRRHELLLSEVVQDHDVCIHVEDVVAVGWVSVCSPLFWLWAPEGEHVIAVFGLIIHAVKAGHLHTHRSV